MPNANRQHFAKDIDLKAMGNRLNSVQEGFGPNRWAGSFREDLDWWLGSSFQHIPTIEAPVVMTLKWASMFQWPIWMDGTQVANTFGRLLKLSPEVMKLASAVLLEMGKIDPEAIMPAERDSPLLGYMGVHLRLEGDTLDWWPKEQAQIDSYLARAEMLKLRPKTIYLASGSANGADHFSGNASLRLHARTVRKEMLLQGEDLERLKSLQWDQQGLVDYLVLLRSKYFTGMMQSSFSQNLAVRRHLLQDGVNTLIWRGYHDKWSYLYGNRRDYRGDWLFFALETMWP